MLKVKHRITTCIVLSILLIAVLLFITQTAVKKKKRMLNMEQICLQTDTSNSFTNIKNNKVVIVNEYIERNNILFPKEWLENEKLTPSSVDGFLERIIVRHNYSMDRGIPIGKPCEPGKDTSNSFTNIKNNKDFPLEPALSNKCPQYFTPGGHIFRVGLSKYTSRVMIKQPSIPAYFFNLISCILLAQVVIVNEYIERNNILFPKEWLENEKLTPSSVDGFLERIIVRHNYSMDRGIPIGKPCEPGKGLEAERSKFTMVTSLFDIGRENWKNQEQMRSYETYLQYLSLVLQYDINMVIFIEPKGVDFVRCFRSKCMNRTKIIVSSYDNQEFAKYEDRLNHILQSEKWRENNELLDSAEQYANYIVTTNSKVLFLQKAASMNLFNTTHFYWIDAGYGHGEKKYFPPGNTWAPTKILGPEHAGKFIILKLRDPDFFRDKLDCFYKVDTDPAFAGGFHGGDFEAISKFALLYKKHFLKAMDDGYTDDDQGFYLLSYFENPHLFYAPKGDWFDCFHIFR